MIQCFMVGLGGGVGALFRYLLGKIHFPIETTFPIMTLCINILGAFVIGMVVSGAERYGLEESKWILFLKTGVCGGFTTFSTFSLETMTLLEQGKVNHAIFYTILSVVLCLIGIFIGKNIF